MKLSYFTLFLLGCVLFLTECNEPEIVLKENITITQDSLVIAKNEFLSWRLSVTVENSTSDSVIWSSENTRIATVSEKGYVTGINAGVTYIVATLVNGKASAKCKVTVKDNNDYKFRLVLKDKGTTGFTVNKPEEFLSQKSIERRVKQNLLVDESDLPISADYIKEIEKTGAVVVAKSKWLKTVTINCSDYFLMDKLKQLPFVEDVVLVWRSNKPVALNAKENINKVTSVLNTNSTDSIYGSAFDNINLNKGQLLHALGFKGEGIDIAVIDAAFVGITSNPQLKNIHIKGAKSFIYEDQDPYGTDDHGVWTTSCMATNMPGYYVGTAPEANYWLLRSEDINSEYPVEQDYWVAAIEYADSVGVDVVNTSLYYTYSSFAPYHYIFENLDGKTEFATQGANMAADKGILIVCCAGNESSWVGTPCDSPNVLAVGAVNNKGVIAGFSSFGLTVDGRMKPDVVALGSGAAVIDQTGTYIDHRSGTSYSSPVLCGLVACLWQANPQLTNKQLMDIIRKSADRYNNPQLPYGYGIPDMQKALELAR